MKLKPNVVWLLMDSVSEREQEKITLCYCIISLVDTGGKNVFENSSEEQNSKTTASDLLRKQRSSGSVRCGEGRARFAETSERKRSVRHKTQQAAL